MNFRAIFRLTFYISSAANYTPHVLRQFVHWCLSTEPTFYSAVPWLQTPKDLITLHILWVVMFKQSALIYLNSFVKYLSFHT